MDDKLCQNIARTYLLSEIAKRTLQSGPDGFRGLRETFHDSICTVVEYTILVLSNEVVEDSLNE